MQHNDSVTITKENVATFISEESSLQAQYSKEKPRLKRIIFLIGYFFFTRILSLVAEKDAFKETFSYAEAAFKSKRIDLDTLIRVSLNLKL